MIRKGITFTYCSKMWYIGSAYVLSSHIIAWLLWLQKGKALQHTLFTGAALYALSKVLLISNGGRDQEKKNRQERHRPLVSIKNIDEATLSLLNSQKIGDLTIFFSVEPFFKCDEAIVSLLNSQKIGDLAIFFL